MNKNEFEGPKNCWRLASVALTLHLYSTPSRLWLRLWRVVYAGHGQLLPFPTRRWFRDEEASNGAFNFAKSADTISPRFFLLKWPRGNGINVRYFFTVLTLLYKVSDRKCFFYFFFRFVRGRKSTSGRSIDLIVASHEANAKFSHRDIHSNSITYFAGIEKGVKFRRRWSGSIIDA